MSQWGSNTLCSGPLALLSPVIGEALATIRATQEMSAVLMP
jgi:hypothetical protein